MQSNIVPSSSVFRVTLGGATTVFRFQGLRPPPGFPYLPNGLSAQGLAVGTDGAFYGVTRTGGPTNPGGDEGTIFRLLPNGTLTTLYAFSPGIGTFPHGAMPRSNLVRGSDGYFYGTTSAGGANENGTAFRISEGGAFTLLQSFPADGYTRVKGPLFEVAGALYGTASSATGGVVYRMRVDGELLAEDRWLRGREGIAISGQLTAAGADGTPLTFTLVANGRRGESTISPSGAFSYLPALNVGPDGTDTFTFIVSDGVRTSTVGTVTVLVSSVNEGPVAFDDSITASRGVPVSGRLHALDPEGDALSYVLVSQPTQGVVTVNQSSGEFVYTAGSAASAEDSFTFAAAAFVPSAFGATSRRLLSPLREHRSPCR